MSRTHYPFSSAFQRAAYPVPLQLVIVAATLLVIFSITHYIHRNKKLPLPPGPRPLPIVGNLFDMPKVFSGRQYHTLSDKYGSFDFSVYYLSF